MRLGACAAAAAMPFAGAAGSAVAAAGEFACFSVAHQLYYDKHDDGKNNGADQQAAPVVL